MVIGIKGVGAAKGISIAKRVKSICCIVASAAAAALLFEKAVGGLRKGILGFAKREWESIIIGGFTIKISGGQGLVPVVTKGIGLISVMATAIASLATFAAETMIGFLATRACLLWFLPGILASKPSTGGLPRPCPVSRTFPGWGLFGGFGGLGFGHSC